MPTDTRRNQGPEKTEGYRQFIKKDLNTYENRLKGILDENGLRSDGRTCDDQRKIYVKTGIVSQAKGSAYIEMNKTKILVSVFDPREIPRLSEFSPNGELYCEFKYAPFSCPELRGHVMDAEEKDLSVILKRALEPAVCRHEFPNFQVDVYALVLDNDGSCLSGAITAAGLALADAGIPMYDVITSVTLGIHNDVTLVDLTLEEEMLCKSYYRNSTSEMGSISLSYMPTHSQVTEITQLGAFGMDHVLSSMDTLIAKCTKLSILVQQHLVEGVKQRIAEETENTTEETAEK